MEELNVKHTKSYSVNLYEEHPHKYDLFGISNILHSYHIPNAALRIPNKDIRSIDTPFIAHIGHDFVVVNKIGNDNINYRWNNKEISITEKKFVHLWSGAVLVAEPSCDSREPDYEKHLLLESFQRIQSIFLIVMPFIMLTISYIKFPISITLFFMLLCNVGGITICYWLLQKQLLTHSQYADTICALLKQNNCNDILKSDAAQLFGWISWSEIGLGYFITNTLIIGISSGLYNSFILINICVLPFTFWSIFYQYRITKQWCVLCLIVQGIIWAIFTLSFCTGSIQFSHQKVTDFLTIAVLYIFSVLAINRIAGIISTRQSLEATRQELNRLKAIDDVFILLLTKQPYHNIGIHDSCILLGNQNALFWITVLTNPHCNPCAHAHKSIEALLEKVGDKICVQYIFSSFNDNLKRSNQFLIAAYLDKGEKNIRNIYKEWFEKGRYSVEQNMSKYEFILNSEEVIQEIKKHDNWLCLNNISATPSIFINGYLLPEEYTIEDMINFVDLKIDRYSRL